MDDASYYTKSKLMFDVSDLYVADDEDDGDHINFKLNKNGIKIENIENQELLRKNDSELRYNKLTNRSIHSIKK